ncbi:MAG: DNA polymerase, partial [Bacteroidota bacterium]
MRFTKATEKVIREFLEAGTSTLTEEIFKLVLAYLKSLKKDEQRTRYNEIKKVVYDNRRKKTQEKKKLDREEKKFIRDNEKEFKRIVREEKKIIKDVYKTKLLTGKKKIEGKFWYPIPNKLGKSLYMNTNGDIIEDNGKGLYIEIDDKLKLAREIIDDEVVEMKSFIDRKKRGIKYELDVPDTLDTIEGKKKIIKEIRNAVKDLGKKYPDFKPYGSMILNIIVKVVINADDDSRDFVTLVFKELKYPDFKEKSLMRNIDTQIDKYAVSDKFLIPEKAYLHIIPAPLGGCYEQAGFKHDFKSGNIGDIVIKNPKSSNNNCFFYALKPEFNKLDIKLTKGVCNDIRKEYNLKQGSKIDIHTAKRIALEKLKIKLGVMNESSEFFGENGDVNLMLVKEHYLRVECVKTVCSKCGVQYNKKHDPVSCVQRILLRQNKADGTKYVVPKRMRPKEWCDIEKAHEIYHILHYDIETYKKNEHGHSQPNCVGFAWYDSDTDQAKYETIVGDDCMDKFVLRLQDCEFYHIEWINAFNGSNFDHLFLIQAQERISSLSDIKPLKTASGIIGGMIGRMKLVDISKHLQGTLSNNLKEFKCDVQKGEFDHTKNGSWESLNSEVKEELLKYLRSDVLGLMELSNKLHEACLENYETSWVHYISTSQLTYTYWMHYIQGEFLSEKLLQLPTYRQWEFINKSIYGGRTQVHRRMFGSADFVEKEVYDKTDYERVNDYLLDLDVSSLYPHAMTFDFPLGTPFETKIWHEGLMGIYKVKVYPNKQLLTPVLPRKGEERIMWDLIDSEGVYTSVDLETAREFGYKFDVIEGLVWPKKGKVFKSYIEELYQRKDKAKKGTPAYLLAKLFMNALYGKTIQKPRFDKIFFVNEGSDWNKILPNYYIESIDSDHESWIVNGSVKDPMMRQKAISKPAQLGAFVLAYSRRVMNNYFRELNPQSEIDKQFYYTDTDSIQVHREQAELIDLSKKGLGYLSNDLGSNTKIVKGIWVAPKMYLLKYLSLEADGKVVLKEHRVGKGVKKFERKIPLSEKDYNHMLSGGKISLVNKDVFK